MLDQKKKSWIGKKKNCIEKSWTKENWIEK